MPRLFAHAIFRRAWRPSSIFNLSLPKFNRYCLSGSGYGGASPPSSLSCGTSTRL